MDVVCGGASPTLFARGGNNLPLVTRPDEKSYCIFGNIIDRKVENGGNGIGIQSDISYTMPATDRHAICLSNEAATYQENSRHIYVEAIKKGPTLKTFPRINV